jgi:hypothetical protein
VNTIAAVLRAVWTIVTFPLVLIAFVILNGIPLALTGIHSLLIYTFGSEEKKRARKAEMERYRETMFMFD